MRPIRIAFSGVIVLALSCLTNSARAVPLFAGQTGMPCQQCHIGALGPQLTPYGRNFKIKGYTLNGGEGLASKIPFAVWAQEEYVSQPKPLAAPNGQYLSGNDNAFLSAISFFYGGRITEHVGAFVQVTYDNVGKAFASDNTDIRYIGDTTIKGHDIDYGLSFNNAPGWTDPYNSNYLWGYPFITNAAAIGSNAAPILGGSQQDNSLGLVGYAWIDQHIFVDLGLYTTQAPGLMKILGEAYGAGSATQPEPYTSLTYAWFWGKSNAHLGGTFFYGRFNPTTDVRSADGQYGHDKYADFLLHGGYQFIGDDQVNVFTADAYYDYENQSFKGSANPFNPGVSHSRTNNNLQEFHPWVTYYYKQTYGVTLAFDKIWGGKDNLAFNTGAPDTGSINASPDTTSFSIEGDWVPFGKEASWARPFANIKVGLSYTIYTQFNGSGTNYDGFGRNASDNNTIFLFLWEVI